MALAVTLPGNPSYNAGPVSGEKRLLLRMGGTEVTVYQVMLRSS